MLDELNEVNYFKEITDFKSHTVVYAMDFGWTWYIWTLYMDFVYEPCI